MSKQEFLYRLETLLMDLPKNERDDALDYYEQYFEAAGPEREAEVIRELGSPEKVSEMIHSAGRQESSGWERETGGTERQMPQRRRPEKKNRTALWVALGAAVLLAAVLIFSAVSGYISYHVMKKEKPDFEDVVAGMAVDIVEETLEQTGESLEELRDSDLFGQIGSEIQKELSDAAAYTDSWEAMKDDYLENPDQTEAEGRSVLSTDQPLAWEGVKRIRIDLPMAGILICQVSGDTVQAKVDQADCVAAEFQAGELTLDSDGGNAQNLKLVLFVPENTELETLEITSDSGYLETENLTCQIFQAEIPDGMWKNSGQLTAETVTAKVEDGCLEAGKITAKKSLQLTVQDGLLVSAVLDSPGIRLECEDGVLKANLAGAKKDYSWKASTGDGIMKLGDEKINGEKESTGGDRSLTVTAGDGISIVTFQE